jgi:hypothetical protein
MSAPSRSAVHIVRLARQPLRLFQLSRCFLAALLGHWRRLPYSRRTASQNVQIYFAAFVPAWPNSPRSQPDTWSDFKGSGRSQSKHWNVRGPLPPGGSARIRCAPQLGHVSRSAWSMLIILPPPRMPVNFKKIGPVENQTPWPIASSRPGKRWRASR